MTMTTPRSLPFMRVGSRVLEDDGLDDVADVLERVQRTLHRRQDVLPLDDIEGVELTGEQTSERSAVDGITVALQAVDRFEQSLRVLHRLETVDQRHRLLRHLHGNLRLLDELGKRLL